MQSAYFDEEREEGHALLRRRVTGLVLALAVELLIVLILIWFSVPDMVSFKGDGRPLATFNVAPENHDRDKSETKQQKQKTTEKKQVQPPKPQVQPPPSQPVAPITNVPGMIMMSHDQFAATDVSKIKGQHAAQSADSGADSGDSVAIGSGPNGQPLYAAEWYREPRDSELKTYMPPNRAGSGLIACRTAPRYHVEDCQILGDRPPGSGIARGALEAAWQFLVIPPRKGGKPLIGSWVQIEITLTERPEHGR